MFFQIYISGEYYDCLSKGINIQQNKEIVSNANNLNNNNETSQNMMHKRDISNRISVIARMLQKLFNERRNSKISSDDLTTEENDIVYLNCSTRGVNCSTVYCDLSALKSQNVGKLAMRLILNVNKLKGIY